MCSECGQATPFLYGPERLCWLCLTGSVPGSHGDPDLTIDDGNGGWPQLEIGLEG